MLQQRTVQTATLAAEQLQRALDNRVPIEQAKGFVARALGIDMDAARDLLRGYARRHQLRLSDVARAVAREDLDLGRLLERGRS